MRNRLALLGLCFLSLMASVAGAQEPTKKNYEKILDYILPKKGDKVWQAIPWRATLWDAVIDANKEEKPILLWAMNGHPLACT